MFLVKMENERITLPKGVLPKFCTILTCMINIPDNQITVGLQNTFVIAPVFAIITAIPVKLHGFKYSIDLNIFP